MELNSQGKISEKLPGRPIGSVVRDNIKKILEDKGPLYGYQIHKFYIEKYPGVTLRLIYYHLKKGLSLEEFKIIKIDNKEGSYSWGGKSQNIIYGLNSEKK